jgi:hypothetical protein
MISHRQGDAIRFSQSHHETHSPGVPPPVLAWFNVAMSHPLCILEIFSAKAYPSEFES